MAVNRFDVYLVRRDPTVGSEIRKTRPCLVISPDEMNHNIRTVIVAPTTTKGQAYPTRIACKFKRKQGLIVLERRRACWTSCKRCFHRRWSVVAGHRPITLPSPLVSDPRP